jgi:acylphosphatase
MEEIECTIRGKVQQVLFRDFVQKRARALWLTGFVENTKDRNVHVVAQGSKENLEKLIEHLRKGPFLARVTDVSMVWREPSEKYKDFTIKY